jgi:N6-L-threonylcarbamoyladenine synthase
VINYVNKMKMKGETFREEDLAAAFQHKVVEILCKKTIAAAKEKKVSNIVIAGGVAANSLLRKELKEKAKKAGIEVYYPSMGLCTDNAAMIAVAGYYKVKYGEEKNRFGDLRLNGIATLPIDRD